MAANPAIQTLDELVRATEGPQPLRRLFHAANGVVIAAALVLLDPSRAVAGVVLGGVVLALFALDLVRLSSAGINALFFRLFGRLVSPREARGVASSTWYMLGVCLAVAVFPRAEAVSAVLVLALADPCASYAGRRWGTKPFLGGSLLGSAVFLVVAFAVLALRHPLPVALMVAAAATLIERVSWPFDDNLTVPVATAALLVGLGPWL